jgi:LPXTG-motif cell wall-anchored protein
MVGKLVVRFGAIVLLSSVAATASAQYPLADREARFTFARSFALPDTTLPAGRYLFTLADTSATHHIVQVFSADRGVLYGTYMTVPAERYDVTDRAQVHLVRLPSSGVSAVESWSQPGVGSDLEFVYPQDTAEEIARASGRADRTARNARAVARAEPVATALTSGTATTPATAAGAGLAPQQSASPAAQGAPADSPATMTDRQELPRTATPMPFIALLGLLSMSAGAGLWFVRRRRA